MTHVLLTPLYPPRRFGGIEKIVAELAARFRALGDDVRVIAFDPGSPMISAVDERDIARVECPILRGGSFHEVIARQQALVRAATAVPTGKRVVIHAHDWFVAPAALCLQSIWGAPLVAVFHGDKSAEYGGRLDEDRHAIHLIQRELAHRADVVYCYSEFLRRCLAHSVGLDVNRIRLFRCGLDEVKPRRAAPTGRPTLLYLGRLAREKDVATLVRALPIVIARFPNVRLRIVGSGSQRDSIGTLVEETGLQSCVDFIPFTSDASRVDEELRRATMLIVPSSFEPFGLVVLEAIARGVPVVVPALGGPAEIVEDGVSGYHFTPGDAGDLARQVLAGLSDALRLKSIALAALAAARRRFSWSIAASTLQAACRDLLATRAATVETVE